MIVTILPRMRQALIEPFSRHKVLHIDFHDFGWVIVFFIFVGCLIAKPAKAGDCPSDPIVLTTQFSVLEDPGRALTIEKVNEPDVAEQFRPNIEGRN
ncbi:MAG: hypothetical protein V3U75_09160, partial [Methylococcaceae bacterium]